MLSERSLATIQNISLELKKPVRIVIFTTDTASTSCAGMVELGRALKARSGKIALEIYDVVMDKDKSQQYGIKLTPALAVQGETGQFTVFYGTIEDGLLNILINTISGLSETKAWFPDKVLRALKHLTHDVSTRVFVENDCKLCMPVVETAVGLSLTSNSISAEIIVASDYPKLIARYGISTLPKTIFGDNLHMDGHVTESEFLEMIFQAEGIRSGPEQKCIICGNSSSGMICDQCKSKVEAEAKDHKLRSDKLKQTGSL